MSNLNLPASIPDQASQPQSSPSVFPIPNSDAQFILKSSFLTSEERRRALREKNHKKKKPFPPSHLKTNEVSAHLEPDEELDQLCKAFDTLNEETRKSWLALRDKLAEVQLRRVLAVQEEQSQTEGWNIWMYRFNQVLLDCLLREPLPTAFQDDRDNPALWLRRMLEKFKM